MNKQKIEMEINKILNVEIDTTNISENFQIENYECVNIEEMIIQERFKTLNTENLKEKLIILLKELKKYKSKLFKFKSLLCLLSINELEKLFRKVTLQKLADMHSQSIKNWEVV
ncbi:hypothetical protein HERIO_1936 [Hepatospora eriocheir]|uniref:Uncharacterized protein n=1 Tax=Hepatospora eriocheir TaxID=1081669 RepID=A0A1X0Q8U4_9MICR|nr:hypothetical protein HERIO_1936 [Hepatospora eriocheir]